jgi:hypothetical protein
MVLMHVMLEHEVHMYHFGASSAWVLSHGSISFSKNDTGLDYLSVKVRMHLVRPMMMTRAMMRWHLLVFLLISWLVFLLIS